METLGFIRVIAILVLVNVHLNLGHVDYRRQIMQFMESCAKLGKRPNFREDLLFGKPWRVYYTWNLQWEEKCIDISFKATTSSIIRRVWHDMKQYMKEEPKWEEASVLMTMGTKQNGREMLLFQGPGPVGEYRAVCNMLYEGSNMIPQKKDVPLEKYQLKLFRGSSFLVLMDCNVGVTVLAARPEQMPYRLDIAAVADSLRLTNGHQACLNDKYRRLDEQFVQIEYNATSRLEKF